MIHFNENFYLCILDRAKETFIYFGAPVIWTIVGMIMVFTTTLSVIHDDDQRSIVSPLRRRTSALSVFILSFILFCMSFGFFVEANAYSLNQTVNGLTGWDV